MKNITPISQSQIYNKTLTSIKEDLPLMITSRDSGICLLTKEKKGDQVGSIHLYDIKRNRRDEIIGLIPDSGCLRVYKGLNGSEAITELDIYASKP